MLRHLVASTALAALIAGPAFAEVPDPREPATIQSVQATDTMRSDDMRSGDTGAGSTDTDATARDAGQTTAGSSFLTEQQAEQHTAGDLIGASVVSIGDETIARVDDLIIGSDGQIEGVVVAMGGVMGIGAKRVGIDWSAVSVNPDGSISLGTLSREQLEEAPEYQRLADRRDEPDTPAPTQRY